MKNIRLFTVLAALVLFMPVREALGAESRCVSCHGALPAGESLEHGYADWASSVHGRSGIDCSACHGGDPSVEEKGRAHAGLRLSRDPKSPLYFTRIPETCGACHKDELKAFSESRHFKELRRTGRGPNCVTCHGSMANHVLSPRELESTCTLCHRQPTHAFASLGALNGARAAVESLEAALTRAGAGSENSPQAGALRRSKERYAAALNDWHRFETGKALAAAEEAARISANAVNELRIKELQKNDDTRH